MRKELTIAILAVGMTLGMASMTSAQETQDSDVEINVTNVTEVDVRPTTMGYDGLEPGDLGTITERGFESIEIENIGSTSIIQLAAEADMPNAEPFGTGDETAYNTGNFIKLNLDGAHDQTEAGLANAAEDSVFHYVNRLEFRENTPPSYIQTLEGPEIEDNTGAPVTGDGVDIGRFRQGNERYFYVIYHNEDGTTACSGGDSELWVGETEHTPDELGTYDFTNSSADDIATYDIVNVDGTDELGQSDSTVSVGNEEYQVYTHCDQADQGNTVGDIANGHTIRTRWNVQVTSPVIDETIEENANNPAKYILDSTSDPLEPGGNFPVNLGAEVPLGTSEGSLETGTMTITATGDPE